MGIRIDFCMQEARASTLFTHHSRACGCNLHGGRVLLHAYGKMRSRFEAIVLRDVIHQFLCRGYASGHVADPRSASME
jgi:hypothetical protein